MESMTWPAVAQFVRDEIALARDRYGASSAFLEHHSAPLESLASAFG